MTKLSRLLLFFVCFYAAYTANVYLQSIGLLSFQSTTLSIVIGLFSRFLIWTLPVLMLLKHPIDYLKLRNNVAKNILIGSVIGIVLALLKMLFLYLYNGSIHVDLSHSQSTWWEVILLVGLSEEVLFRGFILQKLNEIFSFGKANIITSCLFLLTHIPHWFFIQHSSFEQMLVNSLWVVAFSLFFGYLFKRTQSLWPCITLHSWHNFISESIH